jgi:hypothetical protein
MRRVGRPPRVHTPIMMVVAYDAWRAHGTLRKAAAQLQLSHERVRQLVGQAVSNGLVPPLPPKDTVRPLNPFCDRGTTMHLLRQYGTTVAISRLTGCSITRLRARLAEYGLRNRQLVALYRDYRKRIVTKRRYDAFVTNHGGAHPTTTELQRSAEGRNLDAFIRRHWRSTLAFRRAHGIRVHAPACNSSMGRAA